MVEVDVKKQQQSGGEALQRRQGGREVGRGRGWDPFFSLSPSELFSNPFSVMRRFQEEMDRSFGRLWGQETGGAWYPAVEVCERNGQLQVCAELPGVRPEDVKLEVTDDALIIQGERKEEREQEERGMYRSERRYGKFFRAIPLPEGTNAEQAKAQFRDGVLEVTMPLPEEKSRRRSIPIQSGAAASEQKK